MKRLKKMRSKNCFDTRREVYQQDLSLERERYSTKLETENGNGKKEEKDESNENILTTRRSFKEGRCQASLQRQVLCMMIIGVCTCKLPITLEAGALSNDVLSTLESLLPIETKIEGAKSLNLHS